MIVHPPAITMDCLSGAHPTFMEPDALSIHALAHVLVGPAFARRSIDLHERWSNGFAQVGNRLPLFPNMRCVSSAIGRY
jgi:hypothetical protein